MVEYRPEPLSLGPGAAHFIGAQLEDAQRLYREFVKRDEPGSSRHRAPLNVIRTLIEDPEAPTIGGEVQVGHVVNWAFRRVASCVPDRGHPPRPRMLLNSIDLDALGTVGPCALGLKGMVTP
jgi:hypothetical protein